MKILGIETSCDETAAAVAQGEGEVVTILSNVVSSQIDIHKEYGGVVPEVAAREHVMKILPVINEALSKADITHPGLRPPLSRGELKTPSSLPSKSADRRPPRSLQIGGQANLTPASLRSASPLLIRRGVTSAARRGSQEEVAGLDAIAVATGPGLITSLLVGTETAKTLAYAWNIPVISINHVEGHIYANFISVNSKHQDTKNKKILNSKFQIPNILFPAVILTVSGGHTMLVLMEGHGRLKTIGETRDDAAGEAFDKAAQLMGLGYPGGPAILKQASISDLRSPIYDINLPRPMIDSPNFDFSFSGLKTALLYKLREDNNWRERIPEYAREFQQAVIDVLIKKTLKAAKEYKVKTVMLSGGVAANQELRQQMADKMKSELPDLRFTIPDLRYTTDNAAMIATAGYYKARQKEFTPWANLKVDCNLNI